MSSWSITCGLGSSLTSVKDFEKKKVKIERFLKGQHLFLKKYTKFKQGFNSDLLKKELGVKLVTPSSLESSMGF